MLKLGVDFSMSMRLNKGNVRLLIYICATNLSWLSLFTSPARAVADPKKN
jgi:hypothetical protein